MAAAAGASGGRAGRVRPALGAARGLGSRGGVGCVCVESDRSGRCLLASVLRPEERRGGATSAPTERRAAGRAGPEGRPRALRQSTCPFASAAPLLVSSSKAPLPACPPAFGPRARDAAAGPRGRPEPRAAARVRPRFDPHEGPDAPGGAALALQDSWGHDAAQLAEPQPEQEEDALPGLGSPAARDRMRPPTQPVLTGAGADHRNTRSSRRRARRQAMGARRALPRAPGGPRGRRLFL